MNEFPRAALIQEKASLPAVLPALYLNSYKNWMDKLLQHNTNNKKEKI